MTLRLPDRKLTIVAFLRDLDPALYELILAVLAVARAAVRPSWWQPPHVAIVGAGPPVVA